MEPKNLSIKDLKPSFRFYIIKIFKIDFHKNKCFVVSKKLFFFVGKNVFAYKLRVLTHYSWDQSIHLLTQFGTCLIFQKPNILNNLQLQGLANFKILYNRFELSLLNMPSRYVLMLKPYLSDFRWHSWKLHDRNFPNVL